MTVIDEWMQTAATCRGDAVYLCDATGRRTLTYAGLRSAARAWGALLDRVGVPPGGAVAIRLADPLGYATALVGIAGAGRVAVPLDPGAPAAELSRVLAVAAPQACVCDSGWDLPPRLTLLSAPKIGAPKAGASQVAVSSRDGGIFLCTSGTTGTPKGILLREEAQSRRGHRGGPPPADPGRPRLLLPAAVPRQRRGGRIAGDPRRPGLPGARR